MTDWGFGHEDWKGGVAVNCKGEDQGWSRFGGEDQELIWGHNECEGTVRNPSGSDE